MKATELMIGDWVTVHHPTMPAECIQISADWLRTIERINNGLIEEDSPLFRIVEPIPLTKEILEKNGFKGRSRYIGEQGDYYCYIIVGEIFIEQPILLQVDGATCSLDVIVKYVHEFQHALRLCGIEKEIML